MKTIRLGMLGCGNIGGAVVRLLNDRRADFAADGVAFDIRKVLVRDASRPREGLPQTVMTTDPADVLDNREIDIVAEVLGGEHPAAGYLLRALQNGKTVVTANKLALAPHWTELHEAAKQSGAGLFFEASVCGAIPIVSTLQGVLRASRVERLTGIVNGTTNFMLTRMMQEHMTYADALKEAQRLGYAEPDPTGDISGLDAACKLAILAGLAFRRPTLPGEIPCKGIDRITVAEQMLAERAGGTIKLVASAEATAQGLALAVYPALLAADHPLAQVDGALNAVLLQGSAFKELLLQGHGAGPMPTASSVVGDLLAAAQGQHPQSPAADTVTPLQPIRLRCAVLGRRSDLPSSAPVLYTDESEAVWLGEPIPQAKAALPYLGGGR